MKQAIIGILAGSAFTLCAVVVYQNQIKAVVADTERQVLTQCMEFEMARLAGTLIHCRQEVQFSELLDSAEVE
jgi:hypothetical protein